MFATYNAQKIKVNEEKTQITKLTHSGDATSYGSNNIQIDDNNIYYWSKILNIKSNTTFGSIAMGIDEGNAEWINKDFTPQKSSINYGYCSDGFLYHSGDNGIKYGAIYDKYDIIKIILNPNKKLLLFISNHKKHPTKEIEASINGYRMCVYLRSRNDFPNLNVSITLIINMFISTPTTQANQNWRGIYWEEGK